MRMHPPATEDQIYHGAGWSSPVARQAHNLKVVGSNPTPATNTPNHTNSSTPQQPNSPQDWASSGRIPRLVTKVARLDSPPVAHKHIQ